MIEITCTEEDKEILIKTLSISEECPVPHSDCAAYKGCKKCIEENIKWIIKEEEDVEKCKQNVLYARRNISILSGVSSQLFQKDVSGVGERSR